MISRLEANNFRCLRGVSLALDRFHVIAGPNGSGKSTLLEVARLLSAFAGSGTEALLDASLARQIPELLFRGEGTSFQLAMELPVPEEVLNSLGRKPAERPTTARYEIEIGGRDLANLNEPQIFAENLWLLDPVATSPPAACRTPFERTTKGPWIGARRTLNVVQRSVQVSSPAQRL